LRGCGIGIAGGDSEGCEVGSSSVVALWEKAVVKSRWAVGGGGKVAEVVGS
jgi:hypothetical protein